MEEAINTTVSDAPAPFVAGSAKKKATKKAAKKGKPNGAATVAKKAAPKKGAKKAKAKASGEGRETHFPRTSTLHRSDTFKNWKILDNDSVGAKRAKAMKDGITVEAYLDALKKEGLPAGTGTLQAAVNGGYITIKK